MVPPFWHKKGVGYKKIKGQKAGLTNSSRVRKVDNHIAPKPPTSAAVREQTLTYSSFTADCVGNN